MLIHAQSPGRGLAGKRPAEHFFTRGVVLQIKAKRHYLEGKNNNKQSVLLSNGFTRLTGFNPVSPSGHISPRGDGGERS